MARTPLDHLPVIDPGTPDLRSIRRFLLWIAWRQRRVLFWGMLFGILNLLCVAVMPGVLGHGIQSIADNNQSELQRWVLIAVLIGITQATSGILRHRRAVASWISAATRLQQLITRKAVELGADLPRLISTGEVSAINSNDVERVSRIYDLIPRLSGAIVSFLFVSILLINSSPTLGLMVVVGVPLLSLVIAPIIKPLQARETKQREKLSESSSLAADTVAGLRILRGIGGEDVFLKRFRESSQRVRAAAVQTAMLRSLLDGLQILLPGALIIGVIWVGGNLVASGDLRVGELLAFYGYSTFLMIPLQVLTDSAQRLTSGAVAGRRVMRLLTVEPIQQFGTGALNAHFSTLKDELSGLSMKRGELIGVVSDNSIVADEIVDRLGGYESGSLVTLDGAPLTDFPREMVRSFIYSQEKEPAILSGTIRSLFDVPHSGRLSIDEVLTAASAGDILDSLEGEGLDAEVVERGRTLSGGQRQRLALARTLYVDPPILVLDDPTSAVDAHTEARIAERIREIRGNQLTIIFTNSPLILDVVDRAYLVVDGRVVNEGSHDALLKRDERYRALVVRGE